MAMFDEVQQQIVAYSQQSQSVKRIAHEMGLSPAVITAHLELDRVREASLKEPTNSQLEVKRLMAEAQAYLALLAERQQQLEEIRVYALRGFLTSQTLLKRKEEVAELAARRYNHPELAAGIALWEQAQRESTSK